MNGKVQKHQNFEQELNANKSRMEEITSTGQELIESNHYASRNTSFLLNRISLARCGLFHFVIFTARIRSRMDDIIDLWKVLVAATEKKGEKLQEASQQQQFNRTVEDIELWLSEIEGQLLSEDYGKVCPSFQF